MSGHWPFWKTARPDLWPVGYPTLFSAALLTWLGPVLICGLIVGIGKQIIDVGPSWLAYVFGTAFIGLYGGILSWIFLLAAIPLAHLALRLGYAGWGVALVSAGLLSGIGIVFLPDNGLLAMSFLAPFFLASGVVHGGIFWLAVRWIDPDAIRSR